MNSGLSVNVPNDKMTMKSELVMDASSRQSRTAVVLVIRGTDGREVASEFEGKT